MDSKGNWAFMPVMGCDTLSFFGFGLVHKLLLAPPLRCRDLGRYAAELPTSTTIN
jgi:hypothetical protein